MINPGKKIKIFDGVIEKKLRVSENKIYKCFINKGRIIMGYPQL